MLNKLIQLCVCLLVVNSVVIMRGAAAEPADIAAARALEAYKASTAPEQVSVLFDAFCKTHFGAEQDALVYEKFGSDLNIMESGHWQYASALSACVAWETNLPANSWVEYGESTAYGSKSKMENRPFYIHVRHLVDLKANTTYHYRLVSVDERGNKTMSTDKSFQTKSLDAFSVIPADATFPYKLDKENTRYLLTKDIVVDGSAFEIHAPGVSLDFGGRSVCYHNKTVDKNVFTDKWMSYVHKGVFAVKAIGHANISLINGSIIEGAGANRGNSESTGFNPIYIRAAENVNISGLSIDYWNPQTVGIRLRKCSGQMEMKHTVINDRGTKMQNRHGDGCASISNIACDFEKQIIHHCLVKRTRQNGLRASKNGVLHNSEIYVDSWATNSFASGAGQAIYNNRIFCTGYHAISVPWGNGVKIYDNLVHMEGINTGRTRWWEGFGDQNSMNGLRHTQWGKNRRVSENSDYYRNTVIVKGKHGGMVRGVEYFSDPYIRNLVLRDSVIKVETLDADTNLVACVATHGNPHRRDMHLPITYKNCRFISNINILRLGDSYGRGDNHYFLNCSFERIGNDERFDTVRGNSSFFSMKHALRDCTFVKCKADDVDWGKAGPRSYHVQHSLTLESNPGTAFVITNAKGDECLRGVVGKLGSVMVPLSHYLMSNDPEPGKTLLTPHTLKIIEGDKETTATLNMDQARTYKHNNNKQDQEGTVRLDLHIRPQSIFTLKDKNGTRYVAGTMGTATSIAVSLPAKKDYILSGTHADGEAFEEAVSLNEALVYTLPLSKKSLTELEKRESKKK